MNQQLTVPFVTSRKSLWLLMVKYLYYTTRNNYYVYKKAYMPILFNDLLFYRDDMCEY